jgi:hypothetical protein
MGPFGSLFLFPLTLDLPLSILCRTKRVGVWTRRARREAEWSAADRHAQREETSSSSEIGGMACEARFRCRRICHPYPARIKCEKSTKKVVFLFPDVVCCIICPDATTGPSNGAALVSLVRDVDVCEGEKRLLPGAHRPIPNPCTWT